MTESNAVVVFTLQGNPGAVLVVLVVLQQIVKMSQLVNLCHTAK